MKIQNTKKRKIYHKKTYKKLLKKKRQKIRTKQNLKKLKKINRLTKAKGIFYKREPKVTIVQHSNPSAIFIPQTNIVIDSKEDVKGEIFDVLNITATAAASASTSNQVEESINELMTGYLKKQINKQAEMGEEKKLIIFQILEDDEIITHKNKKKFEILTTIIKRIKKKIPWALQKFMVDAESIAKKNKFLNDSILNPIFKKLKDKYEEVIKLKDEYQEVASSSF